MSVCDIKLPSYTLGEELVNAISHGLGAVLAAAGTIVGMIVTCCQGDMWKIVSMAMYGAALFLLYLASCLYHSLKPNNGKRVFRIFDHCTIFLLIAGTYTPFTLVTLRGVWGWILFAVVWAAAIVGIVLNAVNMRKFRVFSMICYIAMGWVVLFAINPLSQNLSLTGLTFLVLGGICYTVGAIIFGIGAKLRYFHSLWHFFVLAGSIFHYFSVLFHVMM